MDVPLNMNFDRVDSALPDISSRFVTIVQCIMYDFSFEF
jgi:hypothetical protein